MSESFCNQLYTPHSMSLFVYSLSLRLSLSLFPPVPCAFAGKRFFSWPIGSQFRERRDTRSSYNTARPRLLARNTIANGSKFIIVRRSDNSPARVAQREMQSTFWNRPNSPASFFPSPSSPLRSLFYIYIYLFIYICSYVYVCLY